jgi:hypothetical protein
MPYTNIVFVKLQIELLDDYRFSEQLNDSQKLLYFCLLLLAGTTKNKIPNDAAYLKRILNLETDTETIRMNLVQLTKVFPKLKIDNSLGIISFDNFEEIHNYIIGNSKGTPKEFQRFAQNKNKNKNKNVGFPLETKVFTPKTLKILTRDSDEPIYKRIED